LRFNPWLIIHACESHTIIFVPHFICHQWHENLPFLSASQ
jgi:hypothetical protein